jgi:hypothetical protein
MIGRREFITVLGGLATWPIVARAEQASRLPTIGLFWFVNAVRLGSLDHRIPAAAARARLD